jgi:hypothetical protein
MKQIVIMPGGFHPFHAGHAALYNSARQAFPDAEVYVAATNDTSNRPFPFAVKEKLAKLAGVEPGHFVQVKSPFQAQEITSKFDPATDQLIFVRSDKDATKPPQAGGVKKDGSPSYLQPLAGQKQLQPFGKHAYMTYLPTVEFGPGMTSATEIRSAWPQLNDKRKQALVMSLYPITQTKPALAQNVVKLLDTAITGDVAEGFGASTPAGEKILQWQNTKLDGRQYGVEGYTIKFTPEALLIYKGPELVYKKPGDYSAPTKQHLVKARRMITLLLQGWKQSVDENQGWAATYNESDDYIEEKWSQKYKRSINCANPRGFSQKAHCAGRKK